MKEISRFHGIRVTMSYDDHNPPHFYAEYGEQKAIIGISNADVLHGSLPPQQLQLVFAWCIIYKYELMGNWRLGKKKQAMNKIKPLI